MHVTFRRRIAAVRKAILAIPGPKLLLYGYTSYMLLGWVLLSLPVAQAVPIDALDNLFIATSAVSTTGLVTIDVGSSYSFFGQLVVLTLIQLGGLGYMTIGSFAVLALQHRLGRMREQTLRASFHLPDDINVGTFIRSVMVFTLICETLGAVALFAMFNAQGVTPKGSRMRHGPRSFIQCRRSAPPGSAYFRTVWKGLPPIPASTS